MRQCRLGHTIVRPGDGTVGTGRYHGGGGVVHFGRNHCMCTVVKGFLVLRVPRRTPDGENGAAQTRRSPRKGNGGPHPQRKASTHLEAAIAMILSLVGSEDSNQQQGWCGEEGCGAVIGSAMRRAGSSPVMSADWSRQDCPPTLFLGTKVTYRLRASRLALCCYWLLTWRRRYGPCVGVRGCRGRALATGDRRFESRLGTSVCAPVKKLALLASTECVG